jgi:hypothetical protein
LCVLNGGTWNGVSCDMGGGGPVTPDPAQQCAAAGGTWNGMFCDMGDGDPAPAGPGPADPAPAPTTQDTAADAIDNVQVTLGKQNAAIQKALQSGLIDISTAAEMWDTQRKQIYKDFVDQYGGAGDQYASEDERIAGQRAAERKKILADLDMRGVDASMVGEELSILDALVGSQTNANVDYMRETGDIAAMADQDRQWLGEGIFGGYEQDLRSQMRNLGLGLEIDSATAEGERLDQALSSNALAEYLGVPASTLMGGMVGGVDIPGMSFQTSEREAGQDFASAEALLGRDWQGGENALNRDFATGERLAGELFTGGQNDLTRGIQADAFAEQQRQFNQGVRSDAADNIRSVREREEDVAYRDALLEAQTAADEASAATQAEQWQSSFDASTMGQDTQRWVQDENGALIENPMYGMTPAQQADYTLDLLAAGEQPETNATSNLMNYLAQRGDPQFTNAALTAIHDVINNSDTLVSKGLSETNVLYALGQLSNTVGEDGVSYPYRDMFQIVQQGVGRTTSPGLDGFVPPGAVGTGDENLTAVADAAAGDRTTFIPGGGDFGIDTTVAPLPAGQQPGNASQHEVHYEQGSPIAFYLNDGRPIYRDGEGMYLMYFKGGEIRRFYKGDGWRWPADQEWPKPLVQQP